MRRVLLLLLLMLFLAACGGGGTPETAADVSNAITEEPAEEAMEEEPADNTGTEEEAPDEEAMEDAEETAGGEEIQYEGIDPVTGLEINPETVPMGTEFIVRGSIAQLTTTPQDAPEFVVRAPNGKTYRMRTQPLRDISIVD